jgi:Flp pilus assembly protein TadG
MQIDQTFKLPDRGARPALRRAATVMRLQLQGLSHSTGIGHVLKFVSNMDERGVTLVEFGFVAPMLLLLMASIVDLGIMLTTQSLLDGATRDAARMVRTGQVQIAGSPITTFQNQLCSGMSPVMSTASCHAKLVFDVEKFDNFGEVAFTPCGRNANQPGSVTACTFLAGDAGDIVGVQVTYIYSFIVPWVGSCLTGGSCWMGIANSGDGRLGSNQVALISTVVMKNEPFPD